MLVPKLDVEGLTTAELRRLVVELLGEVSRLAEENATLHDEVARLKGLKQHPKIKPSGMEQATTTRAGKRKTKVRNTTAKRVVHEERVLAITARPARGSRATRSSSSRTYGSRHG